MNKRFSASRKGQSAIEYLMTYGWMLLVVAIVGGAVITTVQNQQSQCSGEIPTSLDAAQQGFGVESFGVGDSKIQVVLKNNGQDDVNVTSVTIDGNSATAPSDTVLSLNEKAKWTDTGSSSDSCKDVEIDVTYDKGSITGQTLSGNISAKVA